MGSAASSRTAAARRCCPSTTGSHPSTPYPAALDDCDTAWYWLRNTSDELGLAVDRVALAGDSAGGALAAGLALRLRDRGKPAERLQALVYPCIDPALDSASAVEFARGYRLTRANMRWFWRRLRGRRRADTGGRAGPRRKPARAPSALVITASHDSCGTRARPTPPSASRLVTPESLRGPACFPGVVWPAAQPLRVAVRAAARRSRVAFLRPRRPARTHSGTTGLPLPGSSVSHIPARGPRFGTETVVSMLPFASGRYTPIETRRAVSFASHSSYTCCSRDAGSPSMRIGCDGFRPRSSHGAAPCAMPGAAAHFCPAQDPQRAESRGRTIQARWPRRRAPTRDAPRGEFPQKRFQPIRAARRGATRAAGSRAGVREARRSSGGGPAVTQQLLDTIERWVVVEGVDAHVIPRLLRVLVREGDEDTVSSTFLDLAFEGIGEQRGGGVCES